MNSKKKSHNQPPQPYPYWNDTDFGVYSLCAEEITPQKQKINKRQ